MRGMILVGIGIATVVSLAAPVDVGDRLQVMWDDYVVDAEQTTATRLLHHPVYAGTAMTWDKSWEGDGSEVPSLVVDTDKDGNPLTYMDILCSDEDIAEKIDLKIKSSLISRAMRDALCERERKIIALRYGMTPDGKCLAQREVAKLLGISRSYVSRIEKTALEKIRDYMAAGGA